ncbi:uncharacterized protein METZ01_LOCUS489335, partial [marine metagenome]
VKGLPYPAIFEYNMLAAEPVCGTCF